MKTPRTILTTTFIMIFIILLGIPVASADPGSASWDGEAGDGMWSNPLNWSGDTLPQPSDDISIDTSGGSLGDIHVDIDVTLQGSTTVGSPSGVLTGYVTLIIDSGVIVTQEGSTSLRRGASLINEGTIQGGGSGNISIIAGDLTNNNTVTGISSNVNGGVYTNNGTMDDISIHMLNGTFENNGVVDNATLRSPPSSAGSPEIPQQYRGHD